MKQLINEGFYFRWVHRGGMGSEKCSQPIFCHSTLYLNMFVPIFRSIEPKINFLRQVSIFRVFFLWKIEKIDFGLTNRYFEMEKRPECHFPWQITRWIRKWSLFSPSVHPSRVPGRFPKNNGFYGTRYLSRSSTFWNFCYWPKLFISMLATSRYKIYTIY